MPAEYLHYASADDDYNASDLSDYEQHDLSAVNDIYHQAADYMSADYYDHLSAIDNNDYMSADHHDN